MLKNNSLLGIVYGVLFFLLICVFFLAKSKDPENAIVFEYPKGDINFAGEIVSFEGSNYSNKQRFDKEYILSSNNLYQFYLYVKRYPLYIPDIEEALEEAEIPKDFIYMPIAESALRNDVVSSAGAAGIWQFMPETAKRYGLQVDEFIDERYNVTKATQAAIEYLGDLYDIFDDWSLVAAAYNRGENGLRRDMASQGIDNYYDLYLNDETSRYVFRILAIKYTMQSYFERKAMVDTLIGGVYKKPDIQTILVTGNIDLKTWAQQNGYNYKDIRNLNKWIVGDSLPVGEWRLDILKK